MRSPTLGRTVRDMTEIPGPESVPYFRQVRPWAVVLLVLTVALACLVVNISYGLALEYGDTAATDARIAAESLRDWGIGILLVIGSAGAVFAATRRSRGRRAMRGTATVAIVA